MWERKVKRVTQAGAGCWLEALLPLALSQRKESFNFFHGLSFDFFISSVKVSKKEVGFLLWLTGIWQECDSELGFKELSWQRYKRWYYWWEKKCWKCSSRRNQPYKYLFILPNITTCTIVLNGWSIRCTSLQIPGVRAPPHFELKDCNNWRVEESLTWIWAVFMVFSMPTCFIPVGKEGRWSVHQHSSGRLNLPKAVMIIIS